MNKKLVLLVAAIIVGGVGLWQLKPKTTQDQASSSEKSNSLEAMMKNNVEVDTGTIERAQNDSVDTDALTLSGKLENSLKSTNIRGTDFSSEVSGQAYAGIIDKQYVLHATFEGLPVLANGDFYEGWVVNRATGSVISTGPLELVNGEPVNNYTTQTDLTNHTFYVLTVEPDDGNPAPADHVVEGVLY